MKIEILNNIKKGRLSRGLSQEDMAAKLNIDSSTYGYIERGKSELTIARLSEIADIFESTISELCSDKRTKTPIDHNQQFEISIQIKVSDATKGIEILEMLNSIKNIDKY